MILDIEYNVIICRMVVETIVLHYVQPSIFREKREIGLAVAECFALVF